MTPEQRRQLARLEQELAKLHALLARVIVADGEIEFTYFTDWCDPNAPPASPPSLLVGRSEVRIAIRNK